jgi:predicted ribosome quality control (RQC) complex YloA/Tae2 family protein
MKKSFTSLELHYIVPEFQDLVDSRVDRIYHPSPECLIFQLFVSSQGKKLLKIELPGFVYITTSKTENPEKPSEFCVQIRKYLDNAFLRSIIQKDSERIVEIFFEKKEKFILIIELFSKGNIVLCDDKYNVIHPLYAQKLHKRSIIKGESYTFPPLPKNAFSITEKDFIGIITNSKRDSLVKSLAVDLGIGGSYAEELCLLTGVDKTKKSASDKECKMLYDCFQKLLSLKANPCVIYDAQQMVVDVVPFDLQLYKHHEKKYFATYSEALDSAAIKKIPKEQKQLLFRIEKLRRIIDQQQHDILEMGEKLVKEQASADAIYGNYQLVSEIMAEIKKATAKYSWKEITEKLKGHKVIKEVNAKDKMLVLEL